MRADRTMFRSRRLFALALLLLLFGCTSAAVRPGTGDVSFRLRWSGDADLDLHVEDPAGRQTSALTAKSAPNDPSVAATMVDGQLVAESESGQRGVLDVDCNSAPDRICDRPIENIFWPAGSAPGGTYQVWVLLFQRLRKGARVEFEIEVRQGERVVKTFVGSVGDEQSESERFAYRHEPPPGR